MENNFKDLNLNIDKIIEAANSFCSENTDISLKNNFFEEKGNQKRLNFRTSNESFYIDFYFKNNGTTTISFNNKNCKELKIEIGEYIKNKCFYGDSSDNQIFKVNKVQKDDLKSILEFIKEDKSYKETIREDDFNKDDNLLFQYKGMHNDKVTIEYYKSKKLLVKGKPLLLFNQIINIFSEAINTDEISTSFNNYYKNYYNVNINKNDIENQYIKMLPNSHLKHSEKMKIVILQAIYNYNIEGEMFDYTYLTLPALKALEGHIKYVYKDKNITLNNDKIGSIFNKNQAKNYYLKCKYNLNQDEVDYIEKIYNYYNKNRHSLFHWADLDEPQDNTRMIYNPQECKNIIYETLELIDEYYKKGAIS